MATPEGNMNIRDRVAKRLCEHEHGHHAWESSPSLRSMYQSLASEVLEISSTGPRSMKGLSTAQRRIVGFVEAMARHPESYSAERIVERVARVGTAPWNLRDRVNLALKLVLR